jgi:hypothetical protein
LAGGTSFAPREQHLYVDYEVIASHYTGWALSEIRGMSARQRIYWLAMIKWRREKFRG